MSNPNAAAAGGTTGIGVLAVWLLGHFHVSVSAEEGAAIAGGASTLVLWIGRTGIKGVFRRVWGGSGK